MDCKKIVFLLALAVGAQAVSGQRVSYIVSFPNLSHHEAQIELVVSDIPTRNAVFRMSRSSPGRYATHEFGKNVYDVKAFDQQNKPMTVNRTDGDVYEVPRSGGYVRLQYTLYGNYADGTYAGLDPSGVHLNMPAAFMWMKGVDNIPITIHFNIPEEWHWTVATQLQPTNDPLTFSARGLQYFMDCPTKIGPLRYRKWQVKNPDGKVYDFRIALDGAGDDSAFTTFSGRVQQIVRQAQAVFGETPAYDYGTYTFLASINPYVHGDGMEHRNSTMISIPTNFRGDDRLLDVFAHEFFHCWNVKRIRPRTLEPFNFEKSDMSYELWFAEGFTQYYGGLLVLRSGVGVDTDYVKRTVAGLIHVKNNTPGARLYSPLQASEMAVFTDAGVSVDKTNYPNIFSSYYPYGGAIALALDLELRGKFGKTLDDLMQAAWKKFGKPEIPYTVSGLQDVLATVTGDKKFAETYFEKYIYGHDPIDYNALLAPAGFQLKKASEGKAWIGAARYTEKEGLVIDGNTLRGTPLYDAGLDVDDKILSVDNQDTRTLADLGKVLDRLHPGAAVNVRYLHRADEKTVRLVLGEDPTESVVTFEKAGLPMTPAIVQFRQRWLGEAMIRHAKASDWRGIQRLLDQLEYPGSESFLETKLERMVKDPEEVLLVWEEEGPGAEGGADGGEGDADGRILGLLSLHFIPQIAVEGDFARISYFAVDEDARSGGIGRAMEAQATQLARERGCQLIEVHCHERRTRAHAFYFRQGYEESPKYLIKRLI